MKKLLLFKVLDFTLYSHIFVALCGVAQVLLTCTIFNLAPSFTLGTFLFLATICQYNCSIIFSHPINFKTSIHKRVRWFFTNRKLNTGITIAASLAILPLYLGLNLNTQVIIFISALLSLAYLIPVYKVQNRFISLRNVAGLKTVIIAIVWANSVVLLPILQSQISIPEREIIYLWLQQFTLFFTIALQFDVRDMFIDEIYKLKTLPSIFGTKNTNILSVILLIINVFILSVLNNKGFGNYFFASLLSILVTVWIIFNTSFKKSPYYYFLFLDGILIFQYLLLVIFNGLFS